MKSLAVRVLGEFGVDGVEPQALGSKKARLALQCLALGAGQVVPSDALADALWGQDPPSRPGDQLAVLMSRLRSVLGKERIEHRDGGYLLRADWLDATELAALSDEAQRRHDAGNVTGAVAAARVALSLLNGPGPAPVPGEWARLRQAELARLASRARRVAATALLEAADWVGAVDAAYPRTILQPGCRQHGPGPAHSRPSRPGRLVRARLRQLPRESSSSSHRPPCLLAYFCCLRAESA